MVRRLAGRRHTIVTAVTCADNIRMIDPDHRCPGRIAVAVFTEIAGLDMGAVLTSCRGTIMAS